MTGELPKGWDRCLMSDISTIIGGGTPDTSVPEYFSTESGIPWLTPADLSGHTDIYISRGKRFLTKEGFAKSSAKLMPKGTVLFSSRAPIGYVAVASNDISTNQGFKSFVCSEDIHPEYIYFYLIYAKPLAEEFASGTTFLEISGKNAAKIPILLAPFPEQKRIAAKLEKLLDRVNSCQHRLAKISALLKRFRQSVLAVACSGRLTTDWRDEHPKIEPVRNNIKHIEHMRKDNIEKANQILGFKKYRYKKAAQIDISNMTKGISDLFEIPITWEWVSLGQITWFIADGPHFSPQYVESKHGVPFISGRNISYRGIDFSDAKYVSYSDHVEFSKRAKPIAGDVLLTKGGTTGVATVVPDVGEFSIWVHVALLKVVPELVIPFYLRDVLTAPFVYNQSQAQTHGVGNQDLGLTRMIHIAIPLPPLPEQEEIVRRVESLFTLADQIESRLAKATDQVNRLTSSILAKAFKGELVPQDPDDEPASVLLDRIRQTRKPTEKKRRHNGIL